jgi:hypothetical protein
MAAHVSTGSASREIALINLAGWPLGHRQDLLDALTARRPRLADAGQQAECDQLMALIREAGDPGLATPDDSELEGQAPVPGELVQVREDRDVVLTATGQRTGPGTVTAVCGSPARAAVIVVLDSGHSVPYRPGDLVILKSRDSRRAELRRLSKTRLIAMYRRGVKTPAGRTVQYLGGGAGPIGRWSKDDVVAAIMAVEFPPEPPA